MMKKKRQRKVTSESVRATRAGDLFHYRWAAAQVLNLLRPGTLLQSVTIEGTPAASACDYVIDVTESYVEKDVVYQLKYSVLHAHDLCTLSFLKGTLEGYGRHFASLKKGDTKLTEYVFLTNRPVDQDVKDAFLKCEDDPKRFEKIKQYLQLPDADAVRFCRRFKIIDRVADSAAQFKKVEQGLSHAVCTTWDSDDARALVEYVAEKAAEGKKDITRASLLSYLGCEHIEDLLPAPASLVRDEKIIQTKSFTRAIEEITNSSAQKIVVHAAGGVGKTAFLQYFQSNEKIDGPVVLYDCYGGGLYRASNHSRHKIRDAFVEIINELYLLGLCDPILKWRLATDDALADSFWERIEQTVKLIRSRNPSACLYVLIDAADNAEIGAEEDGGAKSFVQHLIRATIPEGCRVILAARTERLGFTQGDHNLQKVKLVGLTPTEVLGLIKTKIAEVDPGLSSAVTNFANGNPRVVLNLLASCKTVAELRTAILPDKPNTVAGIVAQKLDSFWGIAKKTYSRTEQGKVQLLFDSLAVLPPAIPVEVLARVSSLEKSLVETFIADLGQSFRYENELLHFRDEPTESYFREEYGQSEKCKRRVLAAIEGLGFSNWYTALVVPKLLFELKEYDRLFELAKSATGIPGSSKTEARNIRLMRLEYAYRAALKTKHFDDAVSLAFMLGSENKGKERQRLLILGHLPYIAKRFSEAEIDSLCRDRELSFGWEGSHNLVVAVLRAVRDKGGSVAGQYLRGATDWLWECYAKYNSLSKEQRRDFVLPSEQSLALILLAIYYVNGIAKVSRFVCNWKQAVHRFAITRLFAQEMTSLGNLEDLAHMSIGRTLDPGIGLALNLILEQNGRSLQKSNLASIIKFLRTSKDFSTGPSMPREDYCTHAIMSACESAARHKEFWPDVLKVLETRILRCNNWTSRSFDERNYVFLRAYALWLVLSQKKHGKCNWEDLTDKRYGKKSDYEMREANEEIATRIGFYIAVENCYISVSKTLLVEVHREYDELSRHHKIRDWEWYEIDADLIDVAARARLHTVSTVAEFKAVNWAVKRISFARRLSVAHRLMGSDDCDISLTLVRDVKEKMYESKSEFQVEEMAGWLILMSQIAFRASAKESSEYFDKAIEILSVVGDDALQHFDAITDLMERACESKIDGRIVARYLRCAEHAYRYDSKHFDVKKAFDVVARNNIVDALASLSRLRDRGFYDFGYVLLGVLEKLVMYYGLTCRQVWSFRYFLSDYELLRFLKFVLSHETKLSVRQTYMDEVVEWIAKSVEWVDDKWQTLSELAKLHKLDDKSIRPYLNVLKQRDRSSRSKLNLRHKNTCKRYDEEIGRIDFSSDNWLFKFYNSIEFSLGRELALERLLDGISDEKLVDLMDQLSRSNELPAWNVVAILHKFPRARLGAGWRETWDDGIRKILFRVAAEGEISEIGSLVSCVQNETSRKDLLEECLSILSDTTGISASLCYSMIGLISKVLAQDSALQLAASRIQDFESELGDAFGDSQSVVNDLNDDTPVKALAAFLWGALGSPVAWHRWNAAYCTSAMLMNGCNDIVDSACSCHEKFDESRYLSSQASFYSGFARMFFAIGLNNAAAKHPSNLDVILEWLQRQALRCNNAVIRWYYAEALCKLHESLQRPPVSVLSQVKAAILAKTPPIVLQSCFDHVHYAWDDTVIEGCRSPAEYDVEKYWLPSLARVFGIEERPFAVLFNRTFNRIASSHYDNWELRLHYNYDTRDYRNETVSHSHGTYPMAFTFRTYVSFMALCELSFYLIENFPTVKAPGEIGDNWAQWLKAHLLVRDDGYWLSDESDAVPLCFASDERFITDLSEKPLTKLKLDELFSTAIPSKGMFPIAGGWETQQMGKRVTAKYYCVIVPRATGLAYLRKLRGGKAKYQYRIPTLYSALEKPPFVCKGKWRGLLATKEPWDDNHFEQYDPNYGGFNLQQESLAPEIVKLLGATESELGKSLMYGKHVVARLVRWGTGCDTNERRPRHVGSVLWMSGKAMRELKIKQGCDIIIGAAVEQFTNNRSPTGEYDLPQTKYVWRLIK